METPPAWIKMDKSIQTFYSQEADLEIYLD